jgi:hypothetical protein
MDEVDGVGVRRQEPSATSLLVVALHPALEALAAEGLPDCEPAGIATTFGAIVGNSYAASECPFLSYSCQAAWLHVNADWVILEPVDADHQPTPPGQQSHTVLVTNLDNRVQPILRYDLGDSVLQRPEPCPCGNPLPAIRVQGRTADLLTFPTPSGPSVTLTPLALTTRLDQLRGSRCSRSCRPPRPNWWCGCGPPPAPIPIRSGPSCSASSPTCSPTAALPTSPSTAPTRNRSPLPAANTASSTHSPTRGACGGGSDGRGWASARWP